ncbi:MAG: type 4a pilus biogenesis protein PilO [Candidatus Cloacimonetes bacterium]|jgi:Tfp pilus assembly protein PilO|nr:type 4a pilus biogenesis protein PilO [Candidatus Cloacimonadota bacterium]MBT4332933.1 type 4a pilus biogenesis protein PilO [Candidatus Cloacimonadota bacterium]MBT5419756.1 type 4a pilus biogenesis protein PilO [Candidatus Cloacimonadota bacterium]
MMKQRYLLLLFVMILSTLCFFYFSTNSVNSKIDKIDDYDEAIKEEQEKLNSAKVLNDQLQGVSKVIKKSMTSDSEFAIDDVNEFVQKLAALTDKYKISIDSVYPKVVSSNQSYLVEQEYTLSVACTFIQMGKFLSELESFDHIIKIKTLDVRPMKEDKNSSFEEILETRYKVTFELSVFMIIKEA